MPDPRRRRRSGRVLAAAAVVALVVVPGGARPAPAQGPGAVAAQQSSDGPQLPTDPDVDPDGIRREADEILAQDRFRAPEEGGRSLLDRIREWVGDRMPRVRGPRGATADGLSLVVVGVVVVVAVGLAAWVVATSRRSRAAPDDDADDSEVELTPLRSPSEWTEEAERCEAAGDHRGAVRARFRSLTSALAERGLVGDTPGRTVGEIEADLSARAPGALPAFVPVGELFERTWFGSTQAEPEDSAAARTLAARALDAAPRHPDAVEVP
ncbi:MAG: DUF4129 domain-containing protein [Iamia sp.]